MKAKIIYELTEETLEKDIATFIEETRNGRITHAMMKDGLIKFNSFKKMWENIEN
jgi:hypothetical protein